MVPGQPLRLGPSGRQIPETGTLLDRHRPPQLRPSPWTLRRRTLRSGRRGWQSARSLEFQLRFFELRVTHALETHGKTGESAEIDLDIRASDTGELRGLSQSLRVSIRALLAGRPDRLRVGGSV